MPHNVHISPKTPSRHEVKLIWIHSQASCSVLGVWLSPPPLENVQLNAGYAITNSLLFVVDRAAPRFFRRQAYEIVQCYYARGISDRWFEKTEHTWARCLKPKKRGELPEMCGARSVGQGWYLHI